MTEPRQSLFPVVPQSVRERLQPRPSDPRREEWDALMEWEDHMLAFANRAAERADRCERALRDCIAAAGMPDAADGCRAIIRVATCALEIPDFETPGDDFGA